MPICSREIPDIYSADGYRLMERLGVNKLDGKITVSGYKVYRYNRFFSLDSEWYLDEYLTHIDGRVEAGIEYSISRDEVKEKDYLIIDYNSDNNRISAVELEVPDGFDLKKGFRFGLNEYMLKQKRDKFFYTKEIERKMIIRKMDRGYNMPTPAEARLYLDHLETLKNNNKREIRKDILGAVTAATITPACTMAYFSYLNNNPNDTFLVALSSILVAALVSTGVDIALYKISDDAYVQGFYGITTLNYIKEKKDKIKNHKRENRDLNFKINWLNKKIDNLDKIVISDSYSVDEEQLDTLNLEDRVLSSIDKLINQIDSLNVKSKTKYYEEIQNLLVDYTEKYQNIMNKDDSVINIVDDDYFELKDKTMAKIADIELRVKETADKDSNYQSFVDESKLLSEKLDNFVEMNNISDSINRKPVKVKRLKEKRITNNVL